LDSWGQSERGGAGPSIRGSEGLVAHLDSAFNLASWLVGNSHDAQDVVQEAYLRATRGIGSFRGGDQRAWMLTIVRNACFDFLRRDKAKRLDEMGDDLQETVASGEIDPLVVMQRGEDVQLVRGAIAQLPVGIREVVILRELEGMSYKEIAEVTGVPMGTVMSRLARARRRLAEILVGEREEV
jgi:RNA polymerase sigma factor (sigma-70 family)